jgi:hypothetical protein
VGTGANREKRATGLKKNSRLEGEEKEDQGSPEGEKLVQHHGINKCSGAGIGLKRK